jgi:nucleoside-diphosphate-sugar epimerase
LSTYGLQKLSSEYFAKGAFEQFGLPYTIVRPFNAVGIGEGRAKDADTSTANGIELALSHVLPDFAQKIVKGQRPLEVLGSGSQVRCYTHAKDIARGIRMALESPLATNEDFNISVARATSVLELAELAWNHLRPHEKFEYRLVDGFEYDVQERTPDVSKARKLLGFEAKITLEESIAEVCDWVGEAVKRNLI